MTILSQRVTGDELRILADGWPVKIDAEALAGCLSVIVTDSKTGGQFVQNSEALRADLGSSSLARKSHFAQFRRERDNLPELKFLGGVA
jgi:hypothetical protein